VSADLGVALGELYRRVPLGMRLGLEPMRAACSRAGHPEEAFAAVHIAGTNGKGSTSAMVEAIARAAGLRTGLYTSPHLCRFAERIRIDGAPVEDARMAELLAESLVVGDELSFFETATLAAFLAFRSARVDLAVIEVGIGGRLDATNVIPPPRCAALTSVALDHQDRLGETLEAIASEKAAIAKPGAPFVIGKLAPEARSAALGIARANGARVVEARELAAGVELGLEAPYQLANAAVAWTVASELGIGEESRRAGLRAARWPGRFERITIAEGPLAGPWILDGAHNPDGMSALVRALAIGAEAVGAVVFGALADKSWRQMLGLLRDGRPSAPRIYVPPAGRLPVEPSELATVLPGESSRSVAEALAMGRRRAGDAHVVVCGSLFLVGAARALLLDLPTDPAVAL
jgi:dihydrofolate synthase/folylpolyglutamate synthase